MDRYLITKNTFVGYEDISKNIEATRLKVFIKKAQDLDLKPFFNDRFYFDFIKWFSNTGISAITLNINTTTAIDGNYPNQALVNTSGVGVGATINFTVLDGVITAYTITGLGALYAVNDMFTVDNLPGAAFTVSGLSDEVVLDPATPQKYIDLYYGCDYQDRQGYNLTFPGIKAALIYWTFARFIEADSFRFTATGPVIKLHDQANPLTPGEIAKLVSQQRSVANAHVNDIITFLDIKKTDYELWRYNARNANSRQPGPRIRGVDRTDVRRGNYYGNGFNDPFYNVL